MGSKHPVQVIAVTGGKGGIGKTNVSVNLSLALAEMGRRVVLLDADLGLANVDVLLGLKPKATLADVLEGKCDLRDVLVTGPGGVRIVPAASGAANMVSLNHQQHAGLIQAFSEIGDNIDVLQDILKLHVSPANADSVILKESAEPFGGTIKIPSLTEEFVKITVSDDGIMINDSNVVLANIIANNGKICSM